MERRTLKVVEAAQVLGVSSDTVYKLIGKGEIRAVRLGRRLLVAREEIERLLKVEAV